MQLNHLEALSKLERVLAVETARCRQATLIVGTRTEKSEPKLKSMLYSQSVNAVVRPYRLCRAARGEEGCSEQTTRWNAGTPDEKDTATPAVTQWTYAAVASRV